MIKKLISLCLLSMITTCFAESYPTATPFPYDYPHNTPYFGISYGQNRGNWQTDDSLNTITNFRNNGSSYGFLGGWATTIDPNMYLGGEVFITNGSNHTKAQLINGGATSVKLRSHGSYGLGVLAGVEALSSTTVYLRLGCARTMFKMLQNSLNTDKNVFGIQYGLGVQTGLKGPIELRVEYVFTDYSSFNVSGISVNPLENSVIASVIYRF